MASLSTFKSNIVTAANEAAGVETSAGVTVYASRSSLPASGNEAGDQAFVTDTGRLYIFSGVGWYNVALINNTPIIQSVLDSDSGTTPFTLATDGTATTITITAVDSDGETLTYASSADSDFSGLATISQSSNVFTITPLSDDSATTTSGTITFTATDGINTATSATQTFTLTFGAATYWEDLVLSIGTSSTNSLNNSTFIDRSSNNNTVTVTGTPIQSAFHPYLDNYSVYFDGDGDYFKADMSNVAIGTNNFTIEMWIWPDEIRACTLLDCRPSATATPFNVGLNSSGQLTLYAVTSYTFDYSANNTIIPQQWNHICFERRGNELKGYLNGAWKESFSSSVSLGSGASAAFIGANLGSGSGSSFFKGYMTNLHIRASGSTSSSDFKYGDNFTPSTDPFTTMSGTVFLGLQDARYKDNSTNDTTFATGGGTPQISSFTLYGQESEYATSENKGSVFSSDGGDYLAVPQIDLGTGDFTIECWHYSRSRINTRNGIWSNYSSYSTGALGLFAGHQSGTSTAYQVAYNGGSFPGAGLQGGTIVYNQWNHIAVVRSSGTMDLYVNGTSVASKSLTADLGGVGSNFYINTPGDNLTYGIDGYIADFSVDVGTAKYTSDFTPPTSQVGSSGKDLYLPMDNAGIFDKTGIHSISPNSVVTQTSDTVYANSAMSFNGSTNIRLESPLHQVLDNEAFTLEFWVKITVSESKACLFGIGDHSGNDLSFFCQADGNFKLHPYGGYTSAYNALWNGGWHHFAISRGSGTLRAFIDGTQVASHASTNDYGTTAQVLNIGYLKNFGGYAITGYIENFQFIRGVAKYTANFTSPTQEQGFAYQAES